MDCFPDVIFGVTSFQLLAKHKQTCPKGIAASIGAFICCLTCWLDVCIMDRQCYTVAALLSSLLTWVEWSRMFMKSYASSHIDLKSNQFSNQRHPIVYAFRMTKVFKTRRSYNTFFCQNSLSMKRVFIVFLFNFFC